MKVKILQDIIDVLRGKKEIFIAQKEQAHVNFSKSGDYLRSVCKPYKAPAKTYQKLLVTKGFGHSGSGVIVDLLSEFDNTTVVGFHDQNGGAGVAGDVSALGAELDFVRCYGGVLDLERAFAPVTGASVYKLYNFITVAEFYYSLTDSAGMLFNDKYMELTNEFIDKLTAMKAEVDFPLAGNVAFAFKEHLCGHDYANLQSPYLYKNKKRRYWYSLKDLTTAEYRALAKEYIHRVLNLLESKEYLVLDQFLSNGACEFERYKDYVGDYKMVAVYRDPRDVYMTGVLLNETWIPRKKEEFVAWWNCLDIHQYFKTKSPHVLMVRFEDLVLDYDNTIPQVIEFMGLKKENHIAPKTHFKPEMSKKNIGLWQQYEDQEAIEYIYKELAQFCYERTK